MKKLRSAILVILGSIALNAWAQAVDGDAILLEIVAQQSRDLHTRDTMFLGDSAIVLCDTIWKHYPHPLCMPLMYVPPVFPALLDTTEDSSSIHAFRASARRYITQHHADYYVSISDKSRLKRWRWGM